MAGRETKENSLDAAFKTGTVYIQHQKHKCSDSFKLLWFSLLLAT